MMIFPGYRLLVLLTFVGEVCLGWSGGGHRQPLSSSSWRIALQRAVRETERSALNNVTAAHAACDLWKDVLKSEEEDELPSQIRAVSHGFLATCYVRTGRDDQAVVAYDAALELRQHLSNDALQDILLKKAKALQRIMLYGEAESVLSGSTKADAVLTAATCALRRGNATAALEHLERQVIERGNTPDPEVVALLQTLLWIQRSSSFSTDQLVVAAQQVSSPVYSWVSSEITGKPVPERVPTASHSDYCRANVAALDDPALILLDDKIHLHNLLSDSSNADKFWPTGRVLPFSKLSSQTLPDDGTWICKKSAGYGSHGNIILSSSSIPNLEQTPFRPNEDVLLQKMVEPPLLIDGRKFSLRVYAVYFGANDSGVVPTTDVYLSKEGLVKLAAVPFAVDGDDTYDLRQHMTNSGRDEKMRQEDFAFLRRELIERHGSSAFDRLWNDLTRAASCVMNLFEQEAQKNKDLSAYRRGLAALGIPKILGFDFVVDADVRPWLVEVNRFPGLEPRNEEDRRVKQRIIHDAWVTAAARRKTLDREMLPWLWSELKIKGSPGNPLEKIDLKEFSKNTNIVEVGSSIAVS
jgi:hypothetical protein